MKNPGFFYWTTNLFGSPPGKPLTLGGIKAPIPLKASLWDLSGFYDSYNLWKKLCNPSIFLVDPNKQWKPFKKNGRQLEYSSLQTLRIFELNPVIFWKLFAHLSYSLTQLVSSGKYSRCHSHSHYVCMKCLVWQFYTLYHYSQGQIHTILLLISHHIPSLFP